MSLKHLAGKSIQKIAHRALATVEAAPLIERSMALQGVVAAADRRRMDRVSTLADVEFSVFSQWGEDGIIEWLVHHNGDMPEIFVEFGIQNYRESNTRFLLMNRNWRGLVIDGSAENIEIVRKDHVSWRHDLTSVAAFITRDNINELIGRAGFPSEIGILSVDIDGNDYWVWQAIEKVRPHIVIAEYNAAFGDRFALSVPYVEDFWRGTAHYSNLYWGASIAAFVHLAERRGYTLLGSNRAGSNAFFIRNDRMARFDGRVDNRTARPSRFRESRSPEGELTLVTGFERSELIADLPVADVISGETRPLRSFGDLYTPAWKAAMQGTAGS